MSIGASGVHTQSLMSPHVPLYLCLLMGAVGAAGAGKGFFTSVDLDMSCHIALDSCVVRAVGAVIESESTVCLYISCHIDGANVDVGFLMQCVFRVWPPFLRPPVCHPHLPEMVILTRSACGC